MNTFGSVCLLRDALLVSLLLWPGSVLAQVADASSDESNEALPDEKTLAELMDVRSFVEFGFGYVDDGSFRFGRYSGLERQGGFGVLNLGWYRRAAWDSPDPSYTFVTVQNLGVSSRRARIEQGRQGDYRLRLDYAQMPMFRSDSAQTFFNGVGSSQLTLPTSWVSGSSTAAMMQLLPNLGSVAIGHERRRVGMGFEKILTRHWDVSTRMRHESKQGIKTIGAVMGNSGGNPRAVLLPEPIDYQTREADVALRYTDTRKQLEFRYLASLFDDGNSALSWQNPFSTINGWQPGVGFPTGYGQLSLPPDNQFHQISAAGGYSADNGLRITADVALGRMSQNALFLPYTVNPQLAASVIQPLPRTSLDGRIDTTVANLRLSGRPSGRWYWNASLRYDDRDNQTPRSEYVYIAGDSNLQNLAVTSATRRYNEPYSFRESRWKLDTGYRLGHRTRLTAAIDWRDTRRTYTEREQAEEASYSLKLNHAVDRLSGSLRVMRAERDGSTYHGNEPFLSGYSSGYTRTVPGEWENPPGLRRYHLADRTRDRLGANVTLMPNAYWSIGIDSQQVVDDYHRSALGLTRSQSRVHSLDVSFTPSRAWSSYLFHSHENMALDQKGHSMSGSTRVVDLANPQRAWAAWHRDAVVTSGAGLQWTAPGNRLELGVDCVHARSDSQVVVTTGSSLASGPLPPNKTRLNSISVSGKYRLHDTLSMQARLWNERFTATDFALDGVAVNQLANVILLGEQSPDYAITSITLSLTYRF